MNQICEYGCGQTGWYQFKNKKWCCSKIAQRCPNIKSLIGSFSKGRTHTEESKSAISKNGKGLKRPPRTDKWRAATSERMLGNTPWNKGLTAETDIRVEKYVSTQRGQKRTGNYVANKDWAGPNNPWYGKNRSKENSPRYNGEKHNREFKNYSSYVHYLTAITYNQFENVINPDRLPRKKCGVKNGYQLDHIYPINEGFVNNVPPVLLADVSNLRMLSWEENLSKSDNLDDNLIPELINNFLRNRR